MLDVIKKSSLFFLLTLCGAWLSTAAPVNLIKNPGFETSPATNASANDKQWWFSEGAGKVTTEVDHAIAHQGKSSVRLQSDANTKGVFVSPRFEVAPGDDVHFEAWVKVSDVGTNKEIGRAGIAFRRKDGTVIDRNYFSTAANPAEWTLISGTAHAPAEAVIAEAHLGYTNAPATIWYDDVFAAITNPISFSLIEGAKAWPGAQEITLRVANRQSNEFRGTAFCNIGKAVTQQSLVVKAGGSLDFKLPLTLPGIKQHDYKLTLVDAATSETNAIVIKGKFRTTSPLVVYPACPCYQIVEHGNGDTRIDALINVNPASRSGMTLVVEVSDADGKPVTKETTSVGKAAFAGLNLRLPIDKPAVFGVTAKLVGPGGKELASEKTDVHVIATNSAQVLTGADGYLRIDAAPNFPIGIYNSGHEEEMGKAGFTATHNYEITTGSADETINHNEPDLKRMLDRTLTNGMRMMVELPRKAIEKGEWGQVRRRIETFKNHPGLLCWGSEERVARGTTKLENITKLYAILHELDPNHPFVLGDSRDVIEKFKVDRRDFFEDPDMDAGIWWWYPIPLKEADGNGLEGAGTTPDLMEPPSWLTTTHSKKPLWVAIQAYQKPSKDARFPTPGEYRCQSYLSIINGAKGLFFYVGSGQKDFEGKPAGLLNKTNLSHWDYVQKLADELHAFSPIIMSPKPAAELTMSPTNAPVEFTLRQTDGKIYIIAANKSGKPQTVTFTGATLKNAKARVLYEEHPVTVADGALLDEFIGFGVHLYEVEPAK